MIHLRAARICRTLLWSREFLRRRQKAESGRQKAEGRRQQTRQGFLPTAYCLLPPVFSTLPIAPITPTLAARRPDRWDWPRTSMVKEFAFRPFTWCEAERFVPM